MEKIYEYNTTNCKILQDEDLLILDETAYFYATMHDESSDLRKEDKVADYETKLVGKINKTDLEQTVKLAVCSASLLQQNHDQNNHDTSAKALCHRIYQPIVTIVEYRNVEEMIK